MSTLFALALWMTGALSALCAHDDRLVLVAGGQPHCTIVVPDEPDPIELEAAAELQRLVESMADARLPVERESRAPSGTRLLVGRTAAAVASGIDRAALGEDGFVIRTRPRGAGTDLLLVGGEPEGGPQEALGTLYAVYHLLESQLGCRFWAPGALHLPLSRDLSLPAELDIVQRPAVWFRQVNYGPANDPAYRRWHKLDRVQEEIGRLWAPHWVHSVFEHVPPEEYFAEHPEYFSLVGGERRPSQLCLTNPDVLAITIASIERTLERHPDVRYISISQEDNYEACQCEAAQRINEREGTQMGELLTFVNALAEAFPERVISTLAYQYSRKPPAHLKPRANVSIMLCTIEEDRSRPIQDNPASTFAEDFEGWNEICDDIFLWDYEVQFASPVAPFPNLRVLQPNVAWFVEKGVRHLFLQGNGLHTELAELRCYLLAKLAWDASIDVEATIDEFLAGYYGPAMPHLRAYIDLLHDELEASGEPLLLYGHPALGADSWLRPEVLERARWQLQGADAAVRDALRGLRVQTARLPLMYAELEIAKRAGTGPGGFWWRGRDGEGPWQVRPKTVSLLREFLFGLKEAGIDRLREYDLSPSSYYAGWVRLFDPRLPDHLAFGRVPSADPAPSTKYAGGELARLCDGLPGGDQYHENWIGWEGTDARITLDLGEGSPATRLSFAALQDPKSWVWVPSSILVETSLDGAAWTMVAELGPAETEREALMQRHEVRLVEPEGEPVRYLRLGVDAGERCPDWHLGAGRPSWFFLDELRVN